MLKIESLDSEDYFRDPDLDKPLDLAQLPSRSIPPEALVPSKQPDPAKRSELPSQSAIPASLAKATQDDGGLEIKSSVPTQGVGLNIITKLAPAVRDQTRVNVFVNGRFDFSLDVAQVVDFGLKVGQRLNNKKLQELRQASEFGKLYQRTLEWLLTRPHSMRETRDYLKRRKLKRIQLNRVRAREEKRPLPEFDDAILEAVFERLLQRGYLDDQKFASYYAENRSVKKGISQKRLRAELMKKGVDNDTIANILEQGKREDRTEIRKAIAKKRKRYTNDKLLAYLIRQGFDYQLAKSEITDQENETEEVTEF